MAPKKKTTKRKSAGRPVIEIDWKVVNNLLQADCSGVEVAAYIGVHHDTLYDRVREEFGIIFSEYSAKFKAKGDSLLRVKQLESALQDKNTTMLVWLGKQRLGQKDKTETDITSKGEQIQLPNIIIK